MNRFLKITTWRYFYDVILFAVAVGVYSPSLLNGFVGDDYLYFIGNRLISTFDVQTILLHGAIGADYCPLRDLSFALDYLVWGENPFGFHLTNLLLFGTTAVAFKYFIITVTDLFADRAGQRAEGTIPEVQAFMAALLFAVHPMQLEVVYAVHNRGALLTNLFFILSCYAFIRYLRNDQDRIRSYAIAILLCIATFMSREYGIILPLVLLLLVAFHEPSRRISTFLRTTPFFIAAGIFYYIFRQYALAANFISSDTASLPLELLSRAVVAFKIIIYYPLHMFNIILPVSDTFDSASNMISVIAVLAVAGALATAFFVRRRNPAVLFSLLFYLICLIPVLNFFKTFPVVSDRYAYLPALGLFMLVTAIPFKGWKRYLPVLMIVLFFTLALLMLPLHKPWKNDVAYWQHQAAMYRGSYFYTKLAAALFRNDRSMEAEEALIMARIRSSGAKNDVLIGDLYFERGYFEKATQVYTTALSKIAAGPTAPKTEQIAILKSKIVMDKLYSNLAGSYYNLGDYQNSLYYFEQAIKLKPRVAEYHCNAGALYAKGGDLSAALQAFEQAAVLNPGYGPAFVNLVKISRDLGNPVKEKEYTDVLQKRFPHLLGDVAETKVDR